MGSAKEAKDRFEELFLEKSNNHWEMRKNFKKYPGKMYPIDVDYDQDEKVKKMSENSQIQSKLAKPVQDLVRLLFDVETMKKAMLEFDLDMWVFFRLLDCYIETQYNFAGKRCHLDD